METVFAEAWYLYSFTLVEQYELKVCENNVLRKMFGTCRDSVSIQFTIIHY
jgi:hypothetical protein